MFSMVLDGIMEALLNGYKTVHSGINFRRISS